MASASGLSVTPLALWLYKQIFVIVPALVLLLIGGIIFESKKASRQGGQIEKSRPHHGIITVMVRAPYTVKGSKLLRSISSFIIVLCIAWLVITLLGLAASDGNKAATSLPSGTEITVNVGGDNLGNIAPVIDQSKQNATSNAPATPLEALTNNNSQTAAANSAPPSGANITIDIKGDNSGGITPTIDQSTNSTSQTINNINNTINIHVPMPKESETLPASLPADSSPVHTPKKDSNQSSSKFGEFGIPPHPKKNTVQPMSPSSGNIIIEEENSHRDDFGRINN